MVFVQFDEHPLFPLFQFFNERTDKTHRFSSPLADDIPPFDVTLIFNNEYGAQSVIKLYGVELFQEGGIFSINDIYSENTIQFIAKDMDPMISSGEANSWKQILYRKMVEGKVVDHHFAGMLQYRQKLENQIGTLTKEINQLTEDRGIISNRLQTQINNDTVDQTSKRKNRKATAQAIIKKKTTLRDNLMLELEKLDTSINQYEKTKMTWDMNSSLQHMDMSTSNISSKSTNVIEPSPQKESYGGRGPRGGPGTSGGAGRSKQR